MALQDTIKQNEEFMRRIATEGITDASGNYITQGGKTYTPTIAADSLNQKLQAVSLPTVPVDNTNYSGIMASGTALTDKSNTGLPDIVNSYLEGIKGPEDQTPNFLEMEKQAGIEAKQQEVNNLNQQLNMVNAEAQQANLTLESQAGGKDVTTQFLGRQQQEVNRQAAIKALPIQAQLLAAQGNLKAAQERVDRLFQIQTDYAEQKLAYENKKIDAVYQWATDEQKAKLDEKRLKNEQDFQLKRDEAAREHDIAMEELKQKDPAYQLELQNKQLQNAKLRKDLGATVFDGYLDEADVKKIDVSPQGKSVKALGTLKQKIQNYKDLVQKYGTSSFGKQKAQLESAFADAKVAWKEAANLGALTGPDVSLIEEAIKPATNAWFGTQVWRNITGQGKGTILSSLDTALNSINQNAVSNIQQLYARDPRYASSYYVQEITNPFKDEITLSDTEIEELTKDLSQEQIQQLKDEGLIPK